MQSNDHSERLSWGDTIFLHLEREGMPLNVASVSVLEGEVPFQACLRSIESKLPLVPRYLKRVVAAPFNVGLPTWEYDPNFDIRNHVREVTLKHGTDAELKALAGKLFGKVFDRRRPLWDITVVGGLKGDRTGLIFRLHHCLADGIAGVGIMNKLLDPSPVAQAVPRKRIRLSVPPRRDAINSLMAGVANSYGDFVKRLLSAWADLLNMAEHAAANGNVDTDELSRFLPEITAFTERVRFNVLYRGPQKFAWAEVPLSEVKDIRRTFETSVNDVILAMVTATIRRYLEKHGDPIKGRLIRMMVPVNLRGTVSAAEFGNRISLVPVTIPLDISDPRRLLKAAHERTEFLKRSHAAELVSLAGGLIGILPTAMQAFAGPILSKLPVTPFNLVCTNVPGPQYPLYLLGHKMLRWYPYVPVGGEMALNCAILSYDGMVYFGFSGDVHAMPDLHCLESFLKESFEELCDAAEIRRPRKRSEGAKGKSQETVKLAAKSAAPVHSPIPRAFPAVPLAGEQATRPIPQPEKASAQVIG
jgi:diacylglycerol O-acyltransferase / wax synthase